MDYQKTLRRLGVKSKLYFKKNGSTILTVVGAVGVVATAVTAVKATPKVLTLLETAKEEKGEDLTKLETVKLATPAYIPAVLIGASTIVCIFGAHVLNKRQQAALMSAYALLDNSYKEYKKKVTDLYGEEVDKKIQTEILKDKHDISDEDEEEDDGKRLFYDAYSERYFRATNETVLSAEYAINKILAEDYYVALNELYDLFEIDYVDYGDDEGWSYSQMSEMYWNSWIEFHHEKVELEDGIECFIIHYTEPCEGFEDY